MSAPPPPPLPPPPPGEGLGKSAPLVTIAGGPPNFQGSTVVRSSSHQQSLTPAAGNHPLAPPPDAPPPVLPPPHGGSRQVAQSTEVVQSLEALVPTGTAASPIVSPTIVSLPPPPADPPRSPARSAPSLQQQQAFSTPPPPPAATNVARYNQYASTPPQPSAPPVIAPGSAPKPTSSSSTNFSSPVQSLDDLVDSFLSGPSYRNQQMLPPLLRPPPLLNEEPLQTLRILVERRAWGDVLQITADLLRGADSHYAPIYNSMLFVEGGSHSVDISRINSSVLEGIPTHTKEETAEIVALQCHAWLKLRRYTDLGQEIERWNFLPFNDNYDPNNEAQPSSWVPWSLHIIAAEALLHTTDDPNRGTDELHALVSRIPDSDDVRWKLCTYRALANAFSRKREWRMAMVALERMIPCVEEATRTEVSTTTSPSSSTTITSVAAQKVLETAYRAELISVQGRYLLHAGAVAEAAHLFEAVQTDWNQMIKEPGSIGSMSELDNHVVVQHIPAQLLVNEGLLCFAYANYDHAIECFKNATDSLREVSLSPVYRSEDWVGPSVIGVAPHATLFNECINNMAICALYTCRMPEAVNLMENMVREDPTAFLTERVAFNLCTMYELGCDSTASARKKRVLQLVAKRFFLHDVGPESFRIN